MLSRACERAREILRGSRDEGLLDNELIGKVEEKTGVRLAHIR
jgi:hypothetical protein